MRVISIPILVILLGVISSSSANDMEAPTSNQEEEVVEASVIEILVDPANVAMEPEWSSLPLPPSSIPSAPASTERVGLRTGSTANLDDNIANKAAASSSKRTSPATASQAAFRAERASSCSWTPVLPPEREKPFLPDLYVQYNMQGFVFASNARSHSNSSTTKPFANLDEVYRIRGKYPYVRYFSYTIYDMRLQSVSTLHDTEIKPVSGKNPFSDLSTQENEAGHYEVYITKDGRHGYPNEMAALRPNSTSTLGFASFRLQLLDPRPGIDRSFRNKDWGYVDMPVVEMLDQKTGIWEPIKHCSEHIEATVEDLVEDSTITFSRWWPKQAKIGSGCNATEFSLFDPDRNPVIRRAVAVRNANENYIFWCMPKEITEPKYIVRITGILPQTPYGLYDEIRVADVEHYDARYVSFTSADAAPIFPSYQTLSDRDIRTHYTNNPTATGWNRHYTIIATSHENEARRCGMYDDKGDLLLTFHRKPLAAPHKPAIVVRQLLPRGGWARGTEGFSDVNLRNECTDVNGKLICDPNVAAKSLLKQFYPQVEVFVCNDEGHAERLY